MKENMMSEEAFNELINGFEYVATLTKYGRENIKYHIQRLQQENERLKETIDKVNVFLDNHDKNAGKLYYKYNNKYLLSEIKEDIRNILKEVSE